MLFLFLGSALIICCFFFGFLRIVSRRSEHGAQGPAVAKHDQHVEEQEEEIEEEGQKEGRTTGEATPTTRRARGESSDQW